MKKPDHYHTYKAILAQPDAMRKVIEDNTDIINETREKLRACKRIFLVGTGTSLHAAQSAHYMFAAEEKNPPVQTVPAFNFALYPPPLQAEDCIIVVSHRGTKRYSLQSLQQAKRAGALTILVTGKQKEPINNVADIILYTVEQEVSGAHTVSYTTSLGVLASLASEVLEPGTLAESLHAGIGLESSMQGLARELVTAQKIWITGGGPSEISAFETALKIKETSFTNAEGVGIETLFHGPFQAAQQGDFFILIAPNGKARSRTLELRPAIEAIGNPYAIIGNENTHGLKNWYEVPATVEEYTSLSCIVPLQLLAYYLAIEKGTDPDAWHLDDPRFKAAEKFMNL